MAKSVHKQGSTKVSAAGPDYFLQFSDFAWLSGIVILSLLVYSSVWSYGITNWDEKHYLLEKTITQDLNWNNVREMFSGKVLGSYNPLVLLSFALEQDFFGWDYGTMHGVNLLFHVMNGLLVYLCFRQLKVGRTQAGLIALLFAVHPLHVESVAWLASRKDVLYSFFFLISWSLYIRYLKKPVLVVYVLSGLFFALSLLSKSQAVVLPFILALTDYYYRKEWRWKDLLNKLPFLVMAISAGVFAIYDSTFIADKYAAPLSLAEKLVYSVIAAGIYCWKLIFPVQLSAIYNFPEWGSTDFWVSLLIGIVLIGFLLYLLIKNFRKEPAITFGIAFFGVGIVLTLHIIAVNSSLIYERFTYLAYLGLFFALTGNGESRSRSGKLRTSLAALLVLVFSVMAFQRVQIWKSTPVLWTDVLKKNPKAFEAYNNRGSYYEERGELDKAYSDYKASMQVNPKHPDAYNNLSVVLFKQNKLEDALLANASALEIDTSYAQGLTNRGILFFNKPDYDSAIYFYNKAIAVLPEYPFALRNRGSAYLQKGMPDEAISDYDLSLRYQPKSSETYKYKGLAYIRKGNLEQALKEMNRAASLDPGSDAVRVLCDELVNRGIKAFQQGDVEAALQFQEKAIAIQAGHVEAHYQLGGIYFSRRDFKKAIQYWEKTLQLNPDHPGAKEWLPRVPR